MSQLLDQMRDRIRTLHYSIRTEDAYVLWAKQFILLSVRGVRLQCVVSDFVFGFEDST